MKAAITGGAGPAGYLLDDARPRWAMSAADIDDLMGDLTALK